MHGVRDLDSLLSAVGRAASGIKNKEFYPDVFSKAAAFLDALIRNHPFMDGNKRTGIAAVGLFLSGNGYHLIATNEEVVTFVISIAQSEWTLDQITLWIREHSEKHDW